MGMELLKQSTAATVLVGPVLDSTGAAYTGMAIGDFNITKNGTTAAMAAAASVSHSHEGHYLVSLTTGNTDTAGRLKISCNKSTYAMPPASFTVLVATVFDALITNAAGGANGLLLSDANNRVDVGKLLGTAWLTPAVAGTPDVNAKQIGGQAAQLDANNLLKVDIEAVHATLLTVAKIAATIATGDITDISATRAAYLDLINSRLIGTIAAGTHNAQSGDGYGILSSGTYGNAALKTLIDAINTILSSGTYGNAAIKTALDAVATQITNLTNLSSLAYLSGPAVMEIPDSGTVDYLFELVVKDQEGKLVDLDSNPTFTAASPGGTDLSSNLNTVAHPATGRYTVKYTLAYNATKQQAMVRAAGAISSEARYASFGTLISDTDEATAILSILTNLGLVKSQTDQLTFSGKGVLADLRGIADYTVRVDTNTVGEISFQSNQYVAVQGGTVQANVVQIDGENVASDGNGHQIVYVEKYYDANQDAFENFPDNFYLFVIDTDGRISVGDLSSQALAQFATTDTGETDAADGSVAKLAQGDSGATTVSDADVAAIAAATAAAVRGTMASATNAPFRGNDMTKVRGTDYLDAMNTAIEWTLTNASLYPDMSDWSVYLAVEVNGTSASQAGEIDVATGSTRSGHVDWTDFAAGVPVGTGKYQFELRDADGHPAVLIAGVIKLVERIAS